MRSSCTILKLDSIKQSLRGGVSLSGFKSAGVSKHTIWGNPNYMENNLLWAMGEFYVNFMVLQIIALWAFLAQKKSIEHLLVLDCRNPEGLQGREKS